jgi:metal-sulfur cluster biosynthetic enzyme
LEDEDIRNELLGKSQPHSQVTEDDLVIREIIPETDDHEGHDHGSEDDQGCGDEKDEDSCCGGGECGSAAEEKPTKKKYLEVLNQVLDPETGIGIVDMGLIYNVEEQDGKVDVTMTLTSMGCPAGAQITTDIESMLRTQPQVKEVKIEIVWEPAWNPEMIQPDVRAMLWGY